MTAVLLRGDLQVSADANIKTITTIYEAFGRGDVATILDAVTDDVDWAAEAASSAAPWYGVRHGRDAVTAFFSDFGSTMEVEEFSPVSFAANDTEVLTVVRFRARSRSTGRTAEMNLHHYFKFRGDKIAYYRGTEDTEQTEAALRS
jgi:ketosteroid isomerase-like protein